MRNNLIIALTKLSGTNHEEHNQNVNNAERDNNTRPNGNDAQTPQGRNTNEGCNADNNANTLTELNRLKALLMAATDKVSLLQVIINIKRSNIYMSKSNAMFTEQQILNTPILNLMILRTGELLDLMILRTAARKEKMEDS